MNTQAVSNPAAIAGTEKQSGQLGKEDFLKLLLAQLRNQDPLKPMDDAQFIGQLTQFSILEKMQSVDEHMSKLLETERFAEASRLVGKTIEARTTAEGEMVSGVVTSARILDGSPVLIVGDTVVRLSDVISVGDEMGSQITRGSSLIGKAVEVRMTGSVEPASGVVDSVAVSGDGVALVIEGKSYDLRDVISVSEPAGGRAAGLSVLIGKEVEARVAATGESVSGPVESVEVRNGVPVLIVNGRTVTVTDVVSITKGESAQE